MFFMTKSQIKKIYRSKKKEIRQSSKDQLAKVRREYLDLLDGVEGDKIKSIPKRSVLEEIGNSVTHGVGALFAVAALVFMLPVILGLIGYLIGFYALHLGEWAVALTFGGIVISFLPIWLYSKLVVARRLDVEIVEVLRRAE
jgi:positive regulator of sigma E activity